MRTLLKLFRVSQHLNQNEMAEKIGVSRVTYSLVENGKRGGNAKFWDNLQNTFNLTDEYTRQLQKREVEQ